MKRDPWTKRPRIGQQHFTIGGFAYLIQGVRLGCICTCPLAFLWLISSAWPDFVSVAMVCAWVEVDGKRGNTLVIRIGRVRDAFHLVW
jgi:hypothetical protein